MADKQFECVLFVKQRFPDDIQQWPESERGLARRAMDQLIERGLGLTVISDRAYCIDSSHDRWPDPLPENLRINGFTHALVYEVTLNKSVAA